MDVSFHPVDLPFIHGTLVPYLTGERGSIDDVVERAARLARIRFRANQWGGGVLGLETRSFLDDGPREQRRKKPGKKKAPASKSPPPNKAKKKAPASKTPPPKKAKKAPAKPKAAAAAKASARPAAFDSDLHVWGRPFFVAGDDPAEVSAGIDRWLALADRPYDEAAADAVAADMLARLDPALPGKVEPGMDGELPEHAELVKALPWKLELFRRGFAALKAGKTTIEHRGDELELPNLFQRDLALALVEFAAHLRPGWMCRGHAWPTLVLAKAKGMKGLFEAPRAVVAPVLDALGLEDRLEPTISENYMVGGLVPAAKVAALEAIAAGPALEAGLRAEGWDGTDLEVAARKLREAVADARSRGLAFAEATEVYSAPMGIMN